MIQGLELFDFQSECSDYIKDYCLQTNNTKTLIIKAPTGAGKTIILLDFIDKYNYEKTEKIAYVWLTPGSGELEEQSRNQMLLRLPQYTSKDLDEALSSGFEDKDVCFINWERVTKKGNRAIVEAERKNLFERIRDAHLSNIQFILIVDEEHSNNTSKAKDIIDAFASKNTIRVSATAHRNSMFDYYEIKESRVIASGLITKAIYINDGIEQRQISDENALLLNVANNKRREIRKAYEELELDINPLVIVQFPNEKEELIKLIEEKLEDLDITYENGRLGIWMANRKENIDTITKNDDGVQFLLIKQAISTGWDCPRAKILVKLRENMSEDFEIQTIGRLRRMPEARHYDNELLDNAFLLTFDEKYKQEVIENIGYAYEIKRIFLKPQFRDFKLTKQLANRDLQLSDEREIREIIRNFYINKYNLDDDFELNRNKLSANGYNMNNAIESSIVKDVVTNTEDMVSDSASRYEVEFQVNTHNHAIDLRQTIDSFKSLIGMDYSKTRAILQMLFRDAFDYYGQARTNKKLLELSTSQFYAFIINNRSKIRDDLKEGVTSVSNHLDIQFKLKPKEEEFKFPLQDVFKYIPDNDLEIITNNVYDGYTDECLNEVNRSKSERIFERWCRDNADWYYKNGDSGQQYFSIVYVDGAYKQHLFYADYILQINGKVWVIETKGGESSTGESRNIDIQIENKFNAFKQYAENYGVNWGFVRDKNEKLYINNTEYKESLDSEEWKPINTIL